MRKPPVARAPMAAPLAMAQCQEGHREDGLRKLEHKRRSPKQALETRRRSGSGAHSDSVAIQKPPGSLRGHSAQARARVIQRTARGPRACLCAKGTAVARARVASHQGGLVVPTQRAECHRFPPGQARLIFASHPTHADGSPRLRMGSRTRAGSCHGNAVI